MRVLFATTAGSGHLGPLLPFAHACRRAGHEVAVAAPAGFATAVEATGFAHLAFGDAPDDEWMAVMQSLPGLPDEAARNATVVREVFGRIDTTAALPGMEALVASWRPDVVVRESCEFSSFLVAEAGGVPHVQVAIGLARFDGFVLEHAAPALVALGADPGLAALAGAPRLSLLPPSFEDPDDAGPGWPRFRDPGTDPTPDPDPLPEWWDGAGGPFVYVTFGTVAAGIGLYPDFYRAAVDVLAGLPVRALVTVGRGADPAELGPTPPNVHVERWYPQPQALAHAEAMVGHGGFGTTLGGLAAGVPQVVVPLFADQPDNAARVAAVGAGVALAGGTRALGLLGDALPAVLEDGRYRQGAARLASEIAALPPVDDAVRLLADLGG